MDLYYTCGIYNTADDCESSSCCWYNDTNSRCYVCDSPSPSPSSNDSILMIILYSSVGFVFAMVFLCIIKEAYTSIRLRYERRRLEALRQHRVDSRKPERVFALAHVINIVIENNDNNHNLTLPKAKMIQE